MNAERLIDSLEHLAGVFPAAVAGLAEGDARWRGPGGAWSILEITTHLADEEVLDFRTRLELTLRDPEAAWPPIDPEARAIERRYNDGNLADVLDRFLAERRASVRWLRGLRAPDWSLAHARPRAGAIRAGDILAAWAAHDALHLRQMARRRYQLIRRDAAPWLTDYAGSW